MLKWHKPIKHVANVYLLFFTPCGGGAMCAVDGSRSERERTRSHTRKVLALIEKCYLHFLSSFRSSPDDDVASAFTRGGNDRSRTQNTSRINVFLWLSGSSLSLSLSCLMNNVMNEIFAAPWSGELLRFHKISARLQVSSFSKDEKLFLLFYVLLLFHKDFHKTSHTREFEKYCTEE